MLYTTLAALTLASLSCSDSQSQSPKFEFQPAKVEFGFGARTYTFDKHPAVLESQILQAKSEGATIIRDNQTFHSPPSFYSLDHMKQVAEALRKHDMWLMIVAVNRNPRVLDALTRQQISKLSELRGDSQDFASQSAAAIGIALRIDAITDILKEDVRRLVDHFEPGTVIVQADNEVEAYGAHNMYTQDYQREARAMGFSFAGSDDRDPYRSPEEIELAYDDFWDDIQEIVEERGHRFVRTYNHVYRTMYAPGNDHRNGKGSFFTEIGVQRGSEDRAEKLGELITWCISEGAEMIILDKRTFAGRANEWVYGNTPRHWSPKMATEYIPLNPENNYDGIYDGEQDYLETFTKMALQFGGASK